MRQLAGIKGFMVMMILLGATMGVSAQEEQRPEWRTGSAELRMDVRHDGEFVEGVVADVSRRGDELYVRSAGRTVRVEAGRGVEAWYRGRAYRVRDLERGDVVRIYGETRHRDRYRAESIEVLRSVSHEPYGRDRGDRWYERDRGRVVRLEGRIVSLDRRYDEMIVRIDHREILVDLGVLTSRRGHSSLRALRTGDYVRIDGRLDGSVLVAHGIDEIRFRR